MTPRIPELAPSDFSAVDAPSREYARLFLDILHRYGIPYEDVAPGYIRFFDGLVRLDTLEVAEVITLDGRGVKYGGSAPIVRRGVPIAPALEVFVLGISYRKRYAYYGGPFMGDTPRGVVERELEGQRNLMGVRGMR